MKNFFLESRKSKINYVDVINPLLISIVLYLHHSDYTNNYFWRFSKFGINLLLQKFAVGGFFFFSGLKLSISNLDCSAVKFIKKRFFRIYILYALALILASFTYFPFFNNGDLPSINNFVLHVFCAQTLFPSLFGPIYLTIWFVSILFPCYLLFLFLRKDIYHTKIFIYKATIIFIIISSCYLITSGNNFQIFTRDFAIYIMFFALGMFFSKMPLKDIKYKCILIGVSGSISLLIIYKTIHINTWYEYYVYSFLVLSSNLSLLYLFCIILRRINFSSTTMKIISKYSFASFCVFLFQRSIWAIMATIYPKGTFMQWLFIVILGIPIIIILSYFLQKFYNATINYCTIIRQGRQL